MVDELGEHFSKKGFEFSLQVKVAVAGQEVVFCLPQMFMNRSGMAVRELKDFYKVAEKDILIVHDVLDLVLGKEKLVYQASAAGHRGVSSIIDTLGVKDFYRLRLGIGRPVKKEEVESFVLSPFYEGEKSVVEAMVSEAKNRIKGWITKGEAFTS